MVLVIYHYPGCLRWGKGHECPEVKLGRDSQGEGEGGGAGVGNGLD